MYVHRPIQSELQLNKKNAEKKRPVRPAWAPAFLASYSARSEDSSRTRQMRSWSESSLCIHISLLLNCIFIIWLELQLTS